MTFTAVLLLLDGAAGGGGDGNMRKIQWGRRAVKVTGWISDPWGQVHEPGAPSSGKMLPLSLISTNNPRKGHVSCQEMTFSSSLTKQRFENKRVFVRGCQQSIPQTWRRDKRALVCADGQQRVDSLKWLSGMGQGSRDHNYSTGRQRGRGRYRQKLKKLPFFFFFGGSSLRKLGPQLKMGCCSALWRSWTIDGKQAVPLNTRVH